jgi:hypothetical protein
MNNCGCTNIVFFTLPNEQAPSLKFTNLLIFDKQTVLFMFYVYIHCGH